MTAGPRGQGLSISFELLAMAPELQLAQGHVDFIGTPDARLTFRWAGQSRTEATDAPSIYSAFRVILQALVAGPDAPIAGLADIQAVGHRVVHGGERFVEPAYINDRVLSEIRDRNPLAPLHNPYNLMGVEAGMRLLPNAPHVAVFDTGVHQAMPDYAFVYGLPYDFYLKYGVRRYGFHGISHQSVCFQAARALGRPLEEVKFISCHLGNGVSVAAVRYGRSVDTSMGFTPLEGVVMGHRAGNLDAAVVPFLMQAEGLTPRQIDDLLNKESGLLGISGLSASMEDLLREMEAGSYRARLAVNAFCYSLKKYISAYYGVLEGADAVIFTAGIGKNSPVVRALSLEGLGCLGIHLDPERNRSVPPHGDIATADSPVRVLVLPSQVHRMIAREVRRVVEALPAEPEGL